MSHMEDAVKLLQDLMDKGWEYTLAVEAVALDHEVDEMELEEAWFKSKA